MFIVVLWCCGEPFEAGCAANEPPPGSTDGVDRLQDQVGHRLRLADHDHVRALDFDDVGVAIGPAPTLRRPHNAAA
jgi:hypothetical protein